MAGFPEKRISENFCPLRETCCSPTVTVLMASAESSWKGMIFFFLYSKKKMLPSQENERTRVPSEASRRLPRPGAEEKIGGNRKMLQIIRAPSGGWERDPVTGDRGDSFGTTEGGDVPSQTMLEIFLLYGTGRTW